MRNLVLTLEEEVFYSFFPSLSMVNIEMETEFKRDRKYYDTIINNMLKIINLIIMIVIKMITSDIHKKIHSPANLIINLVVL